MNAAARILCRGLSALALSTATAQTGAAPPHTTADQTAPIPQRSSHAATAAQPPPEAQHLKSPSKDQGRGLDKAGRHQPAQTAQTPVPRSGRYSGAVGKQGNPNTACSTARSSAKGGLDCGTGGDGATPGNSIVTK